MMKKMFLFFFLLGIPATTLAETICLSESETFECPDNEIFGGNICVPSYSTDENGKTIVLCPDPCAGDPKFKLIAKSDENGRSHRPNCEDGVANYQCVNGKVQCVKLSEPKCSDCIDSGHYEDIESGASCESAFAPNDPNGTECKYGKGIWKCVNKEAVCVGPEPECPACLGNSDYNLIGTTCTTTNNECGQSIEGTYVCDNGSVVCNAEIPACLLSCDNLSAKDMVDKYAEKMGYVAGNIYENSTQKEVGDSYAYAYYTQGIRHPAILCVKNPNVVFAKNEYSAVNSEAYKNKTIKNYSNTKNILFNIIRGTGNYDIGDYSHDKAVRHSNVSTIRTAYANSNAQTASCYICALGRDSGCFAPETKISLADGSVKQAKDVAVGDVLFNPVTKKGVTVEKVIEGPEDAGMILIEFANGSLKVSQEHPVLTINGLIQAKDVKAGDTIFNGDNKELEVTSVKTLPVEEGQYVINFIVKSDDDIKDYKNRMLLSEGIITGDLTTQIELKLGK